MSDVSRNPESEIRRRIQERGRIPFAEFMELALFYPEGGYYTQGAKIGASGDYFTSSTAHPSFGALIALQIQQVWDSLGRPDPFYLVEMGSGDGFLARSVLKYSENLTGAFYQALRYVAIDRRKPAISPGTQPNNLWPLLAEGLPLKNITGCILSNELLDSFPVHRFQVSRGCILEIYVALENDRFVEVLDKPSTELIERRIESLGIDLPEGFRGEVNAGIGPWMGEVAQALSKGLGLTIDYGYTAQELYSPKRARGTFQCFYKHTQSGNPYVRIGQQDMTAHVDFSYVMEEGEKHGLKTLGLVTQREFLNNLGMQAFIKALSMRRLPQHDYYANRMAMQELIKPEGLGGFKVLAQTKGLEAGVSLQGFTPRGKLAREMEVSLEGLKVPLLEPTHTPLMEGALSPHVLGAAF